MPEQLTILYYPVSMKFPNEYATFFSLKHGIYITNLSLFDS
jgi:hypothetical protein